MTITKLKKKPYYQHKITEKDIEDKLYGAIISIIMDLQIGKNNNIHSLAKLVREVTHKVIVDMRKLK